MLPSQRLGGMLATVALAAVACSSSSTGSVQHGGSPTSNAPSITFSCSIGTCSLRSAHLPTNTGYVAYITVTPGVAGNQASATGVSQFYGSQALAKKCGFTGLAGSTDSSGTATVITDKPKVLGSYTFNLVFCTNGTNSQSLSDPFTVQ